jgi:dipeptide/tripeptide permease
MYNQLFYTLPVFIEQWMDTGGIYLFVENISPALASFIGTADGRISPEMLVNVDALYIVIFQVAISALVMKYRPINAMITGILICTIGIGLWFVTQNASYLFLSIFVFAAGEMSSSPKILEYIGRIAPEDKVALYMGCYYIPMAAGNFFAGLLSGGVYERMSDKTALLQKEVEARGLDIPSIGADFTQNDYFNRAADLMDMSREQLTNYLWSTYDPSRIWIVFTSIGLATVISLVIYQRIVKTK